MIERRNTDIDAYDPTIPHEDDILDIIAHLTGKIGSADSAEIASTADDITKIRECFDALVKDREWNITELAKANERNRGIQETYNKLVRNLEAQNSAEKERNAGVEIDVEDEFLELFGG